MKKNNKIQRCPWVSLNDFLYVKYHDEEWGRPVFDDRKIFEFLTLEIFQAGLSWRTVLYKRKNFKNAFDNFDAKKITKYNDEKIRKLMSDKGIIRNKLKILATINNAIKFLEVQKKYGTFSKYMWSWVNNKPIIHEINKISDYNTYDETSINWSKDLKRRGFKFLGPTVLYAHMQATGMINDHSSDCFYKRTFNYVK